MQHITPEHSSVPGSVPGAVPATGTDTVRFFAVLYRHRLFILLTVLIATGISVFAVMRMQNWFASTVNLVPPKTSGMDGLTGSISSALKDFGLSKIGGGGADGYSYLVILQSRRVQDSLIQLFDLATVYDLPASDMSALRDALAENLEITSEKEGNYTITAWHTDREKAAQMANKTVDIANAIANEVVRTEATTNRLYAERRLRENQESFQRAADSLSSFTRRYSIFAPTEQAAAAATAIAELKAQLMQQEIRTEMFESMLGEGDPNSVQQRQLLASLRQQLSAAESKPGFVGDFALKEGSDVAVEYLRLMTDVEVYAKLKAFLLPMLEQYKLDEQRNSPNLYVLDPAVPADKKGRPKRSLIVAGTAFGTFVLAVLFILVWDRYRTFKQTYPYVFASRSKRTTEPVP